MEQTPWFRFVDMENGEDAERSKEAGYAVPKITTFIEILSHGTRDISTWEAEPWIERKAAEAQANRYSHKWVSDFREGLKLHREGREITREGLPLLSWEQLLKSRREQLYRQFPTVEDLASCPDSSLGLIGLDGRVLRDMARNDVEKRKSGVEPLIRKQAETEEENRRLAEENKNIRTQMEMLAHRLEALEGSRDNKRNRAEAA